VDNLDLIIGLGMTTYQLLIEVYTRGWK